MRIFYKPYHELITSAEKAAEAILDGMVIGTSGFTKSGDSKAVLPSFASSKTPAKITLLSGASLGRAIDGDLALNKKINRRIPFQSNKDLRSAINSHEVMYVDQHLAETADQLQSKQLPKIDIAIIEASMITEEGMIVPTSSVGNSVVFAQLADKIIIEVNSAFPIGMNGLHDCYLAQPFPDRTHLPITKTSDRIGTPFISIDPSKVIAIVETNEADEPADASTGDEKTQAIAKHFLQFLNAEVEKKKLSKTLQPLQAGIGKIANAVLHEMGNSDFQDLTMYSEVLQDSTLDLIDSGKLQFASGAAYTFSKAYQERFYTHFDHYKTKMILRPQHVSNAAEVIHRLGVIALNTAIEVDIYGNVNSTHLCGTKIMNGIGGSDEFARNSSICIFVCPSTSKNNTISHIVPMVSHVDHTEHDVDIIITEQGLADLRGLAPIERAQLIIENCLHSDYKKQLLDYFERAKLKGGQTPHLLTEAFNWHIQLEEKGTMQL